MCVDTRGLVATACGDAPRDVATSLTPRYTAEKNFVLDVAAPPRESTTQSYPGPLRFPPPPKPMAELPRRPFERFVSHHRIASPHGEMKDASRRSISPRRRSTATLWGAVCGLLPSLLACPTPPPSTDPITDSDSASTTYASGTAGSSHGAFGSSSTQGLADASATSACASACEETTSAVDSAESTGEDTAHVGNEESTGEDTSDDGIALGFSCVGVANGELEQHLASGRIEVAATWNDAEVANQLGQDSLFYEYAAWDRMLDVAIGGIYPDAGDTWAAAAADTEGTYGERWSDALEAVARAWGDRDPALLHIRFAHEFNVASLPWAVTGEEVESFKLAWQRFAAIFRERLPEASLVWCPGAATSNALDLRVADAWPGDEYVDVVCIDWKNAWPWAGSADEVEAKLIAGTAENPVGPEMWRRFAADRGKPLAISEWANPGDPDLGGGGGGGESPALVEIFHGWLIEHAGSDPGRIKYAVYHNCGTMEEPGPYLIWPTEWTFQRDTSAKILELF